MTGIDVALRAPAGQVPQLSAAEARIAELHELARSVEETFGVAAGRRLRQAADLVADAAEDIRRRTDAPAPLSLPTAGRGRRAP